MTFTIIKNTAPLVRRNARPQYPFSELEVGDAFDVQLAPDQTKDGRNAHRGRIAIALTHWRKKNPARKVSSAMTGPATVRIRRDA